MTTFLAKGIASALLAGEWTERNMATRLAYALGAGLRPRWIGTLVRYARREFPEPPRDARDELARRLLRSSAWPQVLASRTHLRRTLVDQPRMRETQFAVPPIETPGDLAAFLGLDVRTLDALADRRGLARFAAHERMRHYRYRVLPKRDGGVRVIEIPKARLRAVQRQILDRIVACIPPHERSHGFRAGRSVMDYVAPHVGRDVVVRVDLRAFFQSIRAGRINAVFRAVGYPEAVARTLTSLATHAVPPDVARSLDFDLRARLVTPHLPQGAPTSPALASLVAFGLDVRLAALAQKVGATYGRYADDLALSGGAELSRNADALVVEMMTIAMDEGFDVNTKKTHVQRRSVRQRLAGIVVNEHPAWTRPERERFEAVLTNCARFGPATQNRARHPDFRAYLAGRFAWLTQVSPRAAEEMRPIYDSIRWDEDR
jgi:RNA-directed DNA polymerase